MDDDTSLGLVVGVVPTMTLTLGQLRTGLGLVVHTLRLNLSVDDDTGLGPVVGVVPTMTLTSGQLRTGLGLVVHTLRLNLSQWRMV